MAYPGDKKTNVRIVAAIIVLFSAVFVSYQFKNDIYAGLNALKLIPVPERFTELYFENSGNLPGVIITGQPIFFAFTVHNLEGRTMNYDYMVYFESAKGDRVVLDSNAATIADGQSKTFFESHAFYWPLESGKIVVDLYRQNQQIDFMLNAN